MHSKSRIITFFVLSLLLAGQVRAQQTFDLPAAPTKAIPTSTPAPITTAPPPTVAAPESPQTVNLPTDTPTPTVPPVAPGDPQAESPKTLKKKEKAAGEATKKPAIYSGRVRITGCNNQCATGIDQNTGMTIGCSPRFKGAKPGLVVDFKGNKILEKKGNVILIAPLPGLADSTPYKAPPGATQTAVEAAGTVLSILRGISR